MPGPTTAKNVISRMKMTPTTALFLLKKRLRTSFQKLCAAKFSSMVIPVLSLRTKSESTGTYAGAAAAAAAAAEAAAAQQEPAVDVALDVDLTADADGYPVE